MIELHAVLSGAVAAGSFVVALFFLRFWRTTGDRFFLYFAMSFALEALNRMVLGALAGSGEDQPAYYLVRLLAYALILIAIIDKNRPRAASRRPEAHE
ncbi:MAG: DUF5985 family protein [Pseudomonadota bacterium]|nr:DUF5985 family protein [Pseudomonadota bacterium]